MAYSEIDKQKIFDDILENISGGMSLREAIRTLKTINKNTFFDWIAKDVKLSDQYTRATEIRADAVFEDIFDIADNGTNDFYEKQTTNGDTFIALDSENIQRSRLRVEARKWALSKMNPKKYGDKLDVTSDHKQLQSVQLTPTELMKQLSDIENDL